MSHYQGSVPETLRPIDWRATAACVGAGEDMFPGGDESEIERAKRYCRACPVTAACLEQALDNREPHGVWGGTTDAERRSILRRRGTRLPVPEEEQTPERTLEGVWAQRVVPLDDGHLGWSGSIPVSIGGKYYTPTQLGFRIDRNRPPVGKIKRTCDVVGCVLPAHIADQEERDQKRAAAAPPAIVYAANGRALAPCGTRSAYQRHVNRGEPIDAACRQANTDASGQWRQTDTTKELV
ncbi:WhiB family transcriptional regulator [Streptomyces sp. NPDC001315]|uniref:WhiB family transcriptional regulator n=1 Tax=Streptomyces sp. NPDC001315 TaxID=3364562 RepID=UPI0036C29956